MALRTKAIVRALAIALLASTVPFASAPVAEASPFCGIYWGSLPKTARHLVNGPLTNVRAGQHACFDRLVFDVSGTAPGYTVKYVDQFRNFTNGALVPLRGGAKLSIILDTGVHTVGLPCCARNVIALQGRPPGETNLSELVNVTGYRTFRQVVLTTELGYLVKSPATNEYVMAAGARTGLGLGVRARLPFRIFSLKGPGGGSRLVIDVAHRW